jgi:hypothetical protein
MRALGGAVQELPSTKPATAGKDTTDETIDLQPGPITSSKLRTSIEKKIENIWLESEELGWSYNDFVSHLLEILIVLNYRGDVPVPRQHANG